MASNPERKRYVANLPPPSSNYHACNVALYFTAQFGGLADTVVMQRLGWRSVREGSLFLCPAGDSILGPTREKEGVVWRQRIPNALRKTWVDGERSRSGAGCGRRGGIVGVCSLFCASIECSLLDANRCTRTGFEVTPMADGGPSPRAQQRHMRVLSRPRTTLIADPLRQIARRPLAARPRTKSATAAESAERGDKTKFYRR